MSKNYLHKHFKKNFNNFILSNYFTLNVDLNKNYEIKLSLFFNNYNFYICISIIFNFWFSNSKYILKKNKLTLYSKQIDFFTFFSTFLYVKVYNLKTFNYKFKKLIYLTFLINNFFFNPFLEWWNRNLDFKDNLVLLKINFFLKNKFIYYLNFYLNFFQIPLFYK